MKINVEKYRSIVEGKQVTDKQVMELTRLSERTFNWIMENKFIESNTLESIASAIGCIVQDIALFDASVSDAEKGENIIEWFKGEKTATMTLTQRRYITKIRQYAKSRPEECKILAENVDGSICARIPVSWVKVSPPKTVTEEQRIKARMLMNNYNLKRGIIPYN